MWVPPSKQPLSVSGGIIKVLDVRRQELLYLFSNSYRAEIGEPGTKIMIVFKWCLKWCLKLSSFKGMYWRFGWVIHHQSLFICQNCIIIHLGNEVTSRDYFEKSPCWCVQGHSQHLRFVSQQSVQYIAEKSNTRRQSICKSGECERVCVIKFNPCMKGLLFSTWVPIWGILQSCQCLLLTELLCNLQEATWI